MSLQKELERFHSDLEEQQPQAKRQLLPVKIQSNQETERTDVNLILISLSPNNSGLYNQELLHHLFWHKNELQFSVQTLKICVIHKASLEQKRTARKKYFTLPLFEAAYLCFYIYLFQCLHYDIYIDRGSSAGTGPASELCWSKAK